MPTSSWRMGYYGLTAVIAASNALFATYVPVNVGTLRDVMAARRTGRRKLRV